LARNVSDIACARGLVFANHVFTKVELLDAFGSAGSGPLAAGSVVIVNMCSRSAVEHTKVNSAELDIFGFLDTLVSGEDLRFAGAEGSMVLTQHAPPDQPW